MEGCSKQGSKRAAPTSIVYGGLLYESIESTLANQRSVALTVVEIDKNHEEYGYDALEASDQEIIIEFRGSLYGQWLLDPAFIEDNVLRTIGSFDPSNSGGLSFVEAAATTPRSASSSPVSAIPQVLSTNGYGNDRSAPKPQVDTMAETPDSHRGSYAHPEDLFSSRYSTTTPQLPVMANTSDFAYGNDTQQHAQPLSHSYYSHNPFTSQPATQTNTSGSANGSPSSMDSGHLRISPGLPAPPLPASNGGAMLAPSSGTAHRSCDPCQRRRVRCDRVSPVCTKCVRSGDTCTYNTGRSTFRRYATPPRA